MKSKLLLSTLFALTAASTAHAELLPLRAQDYSKVASGASCWLENKEGVFALSDGKNSVIHIGDVGSVILTAEDPLVAGDSKPGFYRYLGSVDGKALIVDIYQNGKTTWAVSTDGTTDGKVNKALKTGLKRECGA